MPRKEIPDHHMIKLRGRLKQFRTNLKMQCDIIIENKLNRKNNEIRDQLK